MRTTTLPIVLALAALLTAAALFAQAEPAQGAAAKGGERQAARPRPPVDTALDANGDEVISAAEIAAAAAALAKIDANGDGRLTADEYLPPRAGRGGEDAATDRAAAPPTDRPQGEGRRAGPKPPIVTAVDANGDGILEAAEIAAARTALAKLDANGDGRLSPDEYRPPRPAGEERGPRGEGGKGAAAGRPPRDGERPASPAAAAATAAKGSGPVISGVLLAFDPLRLVISGSGFRQGATVTIAGRAAPAAILKNSGLIVAMGSGLETALPKGNAVAIAVVNPGGERTSPWNFIR